MVTETGGVISVTKSAGRIWAGLARRYGPCLVLLEHHLAPVSGEGMETLDLVLTGADGSPHWSGVWPPPGENPRHAGPERWMAAYGHQIVGRPASCSMGVTTITADCLWRPRDVVRLGARQAASVPAIQTDNGLFGDDAAGILRAEIIGIEPRTSTVPVANVIDGWRASEEGPCVRCGTPTCLYGPRGNPLCADCRPARTEALTGGEHQPKPAPASARRHAA